MATRSRSSRDQRRPRGRGRSTGGGTGRHLRSRAAVQGPGRLHVHDPGRGRPDRYRHGRRDGRTGTRRRADRRRPGPALPRPDRGDVDAQGPHGTWSATDAGSGIKSLHRPSRAPTAAQLDDDPARHARRGRSWTRSLTNGSPTVTGSGRPTARATSAPGSIRRTFSPAVFQEATAAATYVGRGPPTRRPPTSAVPPATRRPSARRRPSPTRCPTSAWSCPKTASSGSADIYVDGVLATRVNLRATKSTYRQLVFQRHFATVGSPHHRGPPDRHGPRRHRRLRGPALTSPRVAGRCRGWQPDARSATLRPP